MAHIAYAAGWQVVGVESIARCNYFTTPQLQASIPANQATLNALVLNSAEFEAVVDPAAILTDPRTQLITGMERTCTRSATRLSPISWPKRFAGFQGA